MIVAMKALLAVPLLALALPASAQTDAAVVPVEQAPYHVPVFRNELVTVLNVLIPPQRTSGYHRHSLDTVGVLLADPPRTGQVLGAEATVTAPRPRGSVSFSPYSRQENVHAVTVTGDAPFHNIVVELMYATPGRFTASTRGAAYEVVLDNERVRAWRLVLAPGQAAPAITQTAPGIRVIVDGGELVESAPGKADRGMAPRSGDFFWQDAGATRAVRNAGSTRLELVELELK
jgi:hypothetical protein